jgi:hypothetical protein
MLSNYNLAMNLSRKKGKMMVLQHLLAPLWSSTMWIFKELKRKHPDMANPKLRLWARMIEKGRHEDYDNPFAIPLISGSPAPAKKN